MGENEASVLIIANPGPLREGLHALIFAIPQLASITEVDDLQTVLFSSNEKHPSLIILDADLVRGEVRAIVDQIKAAWPESRFVFLANDVRQHLEAETAGVDAALLKGAPPARIMATVVRLLDRMP